MNSFPESGHHLSLNDFKGKSGKIIRYMPKIINKGIPEHFFIIGKYGVEKTSFVKYVGNKVEEEFHMLPIYVNNEGKDGIEELIQLILESIFEELDKTISGRKIIEKFIEDITEIKLPGIGISLDNKRDFVKNVKNHFADFLFSISNSLNEYNGIFLIIDGIEGLCKTSEFPNWYKSLSETIDFSDDKVPFAFTFVGYPENFNKLTQFNPSFSRIFHLIEIDSVISYENKNDNGFFDKNKLKREYLIG